MPRLSAGLYRCSPASTQVFLKSAVVCHSGPPEQRNPVRVVRFHLDVGIVRAHSQCLHVGANDVANPADFGVAVDFIDAGLFLAKRIL